MVQVQGMTYSVDVVMCVDATGSMGKVIEDVKRRALQFPSDVMAAMDKHGKAITRLRVRVVAFRDVKYDDAAPFQISDFFTLPGQESEFGSFVRGIRAEGGGDEPESALPALAIAVRSDWATDMDKQRHVVMVLTDASADRLEETAGKVPDQYASLVPHSLDELTELWEGTQQTSSGSKLSQSGKRLILFAPEAYPWSQIQESWNESVLFPSQAGQGLQDHEYAEILDTLAKSIA